MAGVRRPEDLDVWKLSWELKKRVYAFTATLPASRDFSFCDGIRRAARSGTDNIAEGFYRFNPREFHRFLNDAKASIGEVRNQLLHAKDERHISDQEFTEMFHLVNRAIGAAVNLQAYLRACPTRQERRPRPRKTSTTSKLSDPAVGEAPATDVAAKNQYSRPQNQTTLHRFSEPRTTNPEPAPRTSEPRTKNRDRE